jgi:nucleotide-binding universal stress UspA family protein
MTNAAPSGTILAVVTEDGSAAVRRRAVELARERGAELILWDADAGSGLLESPLPNQWSAHGEGEQFGDRLSINDLEAAGRAPLARQLQEIQQAGVRASAWLPEKNNAETLREYAARQGATVVVIGEDSKLLDKIQGEGSLSVEVVRAIG